MDKSVDVLLKTSVYNFLIVVVQKLSYHGKPPGPFTLTTLNSLWIFPFFDNDLHNKESSMLDKLAWTI